ncbi:Protein of unknown function [Gryllus bimaculatus]|nr:Protein of unknown function [Gryllus bimaculatus]
MKSGDDGGVSLFLNADSFSSAFSVRLERRCLQEPRAGCGDAYRRPRARSHVGGGAGAYATLSHTDASEADRRDAGPQKHSSR